MSFLDKNQEGNMIISVELAKKLLGENANKYSDEQLMKIIEFFTTVANIVSK